MENVILIRDIPDDFVLAQCDTDVSNLLQYANPVLLLMFGIPRLLFVQVGDAEVAAMYGVYSAVPRLHDPAFRLL